MGEMRFPKCTCTSIMHFWVFSGRSEIIENFIGRQASKRKGIEKCEKSQRSTYRTTSKRLT